MRRLSTVNNVYCHCSIIHHSVESVRHKNKVEIYKTGFEPVKNVNFVAVFINRVNCSTVESIGFHKQYLDKRRRKEIPTHAYAYLEKLKETGQGLISSYVSNVKGDMLRRLCSLVKLVIFSVVPPWEIQMLPFRDVALYS